jgi:hypothetical protein
MYRSSVPSYEIHCVFQLVGSEQDVKEMLLANIPATGDANDDFQRGAAVTALDGDPSALAVVMFRPLLEATRAMGESVAPLALSIDIARLIVRRKD